MRNCGWLYVVGANLWAYRGRTRSATRIARRAKASSRLCMIHLRPLLSAASVHNQLFDRARDCKASDCLRRILRLRRTPEYTTLWRFAQEKVTPEVIEEALAETVRLLPCRAEDTRSVALDSTGLWTTPASFTLASSKTFWMRWTCCARSRTSCLQVRVRSRSSWMGWGGTKLERISPWARRSAIYSASFTSVLRPGTFLISAALPSVRAKWPSRMCQIGFQ